MKKIVIDSHCDTVLKIYEGSNINSLNNQFRLDNALEYYKYIQFFAMYIEPEYIDKSPFDLCVNLINTLNSEIEKNTNKIMIVEDKKSLKKYIDEDNKMLGAVISVEDGIALEGKIENLYRLYEKKVRLLGLTWNNRNEIASGANCTDREDIGLTDFGREVIDQMNNLGMIADVSHLSEKSFWDTIKITKKPLIASHSCSKSVCNHKRNLNDEQIKAISENGGVVGINLYKEFIGNNDEANIDLVIKHMQHIINIGGTDCVGIGSDFDGIKTPVIGLENNSKFENLFYYLKKYDFSEETIDKIMWKNYMEFLDNNLK
ncbi:MAG: dipeptidase [Clostridia bacterium]|nr:dipeptidase [Clostridia bacterium]